MLPIVAGWPQSHGCQIFVPSLHSQANRTVDQWREIVAPLSSAWSVLQKTSELGDDLAVVANDYVPMLNATNGAPCILRTNPIQLDEHHVQPTGAPEHGQQTQEVMLEAGIDCDKIKQYRTDRCCDQPPLRRSTIGARSGGREPYGIWK